MTYIMQLLLKTILETGYLIGVILLIGLLLGFLRKYTLRNFQRSMGSKIVMITGVIGVPIHELSHAIAALLFGHKITRVKLLQKPDENGVMGYVSHSYNQNNLYQQAGNFFIGIAPIFGATISILALMRFIIPRAFNNYLAILENSLQVTNINKEFFEGLAVSYYGLIKVIFSVDNFKNPYFYLFLFLCICIASHISLSRADIKGAAKGLFAIFFILLAINILDISHNIMTVNFIRYNIFLTGMLSISLLLSFLTYILSLIFYARR